MRRAIFIFILLVIITTFILSEIIVLKDNRTITGKIIKMDEDTMTVITKTEEMVIDKEDIKTIYYSEKEYAEDKNENKKTEISEQEKKLAANRLAGKLWSKAQKLVNENKKKEAAEVFDKEIESDPNNGYLYKMRAEFYLWLMHDNEKTIVNCNKALELIKSDNSAIAEIYCLMGRVYAWNKNPNPDKAIGNFNKAIELNPMFAEAYRDRGDVYLQMGLFDKALEDLNRAKELNPRDGWVHIQLGRYFRSKNWFDEAIKEYNAGIELIINRYGEIDDWPYQELGELYLMKNRREDAINAFKTSEKLGNNWAKKKLEELEKEEKMIKVGYFKKENIPICNEAETVKDFAQPILDMISNTKSHFNNNFLKKEYLWPNVFGGKTITDGDTNIYIYTSSKNITLSNPKMNHKNFVLILEVDLKKIDNDIYIRFHGLELDKNRHHLEIKIGKNGYAESKIQIDKFGKQITTSQIEKKYFEEESSRITLLSFNNSYTIYINSDLLFSFNYKPEWESNAMELSVSYNKDYDINEKKIEIPFKNFEIWDLDRLTVSQ